MSFLTHITLRNFRCFRSTELHPQEGLNFLIGSNAQGKTSFLEAACVLLRLKSPRTHTLHEAIHFGEKAFLLEGNYNNKKLSLRFTTQRQPKRVLTLDDVIQQETSDYLNTGCIVWFGNDDREMINGPGECRRRFLDSAGLQMSQEYRHHLKFYDRALRSRNMLLRMQRPRAEIAAYDLPLAESGDALIQLRSQLSASLQPQAAAACVAIAGEKMTLTYRPGATIPMRAALAESQAKESQLRTTVVGPHRDELFITLNDLPLATFGSEGQRRTAALALKLALANLLHTERKTPPLLLLDDIFGELDPQRRSALLAGLPQGAQALLTTTDLEGMELPNNATIFQISSRAEGANSYYISSP